MTIQLNAARSQRCITNRTRREMAIYNAYMALYNNEAGIMIPRFVLVKNRTLLRQ